MFKNRTERFAHRLTTSTNLFHNAMRSKPAGSSMQSQLFAAAKGGDAARVAQVLRQRPDAAESVNHHGQTALMIASQHGHSEVIARLLPFSDPLAIDQQQRFALGFAVRRSDVKVVTALLHAQAHEQAAMQGPDGETALMTAVAMNNLPLIELLLPVSTLNTLVTLPNRQQINAVHLAIAHGHGEVVDRLVRGWLNGEGKDDGTSDEGLDNAVESPSLVAMALQHDLDMLRRVLPISDLQQVNRQGLTVFEQAVMVKAWAMADELALLTDVSTVQAWNVPPLPLPRWNREQEAKTLQRVSLDVDRSMPKPRL